MHRNLIATDNYLEKYLPVKIQNFITETISNVIENKKVLGRLLRYDIECYKTLHQRILDDEGYPALNKQEFSPPDMDTIRKKIALIEDQEIKDDSEFLPSEYSVQKSRKRRSKRRKPSASESPSAVSRASNDKSLRRPSRDLRPK